MSQNEIIEIDLTDDSAPLNPNSNESKAVFTVPIHEQLQYNELSTDKEAAAKRKPTVAKPKRLLTWLEQNRVKHTRKLHKRRGIKHTRTPAPIGVNLIEPCYKEISKNVFVATTPKPQQEPSTRLYVRPDLFEAPRTPVLIDLTDKETPAVPTTAVHPPVEETIVKTAVKPTIIVKPTIVFNRAVKPSAAAPHNTTVKTTIEPCVQPLQTESKNKAVKTAAAEQPLGEEFVIDNNPVLPSLSPVLIDLTEKKSVIVPTTAKPSIEQAIVKPTIKQTIEPRIQPLQTEATTATEKKAAAAPTQISAKLPLVQEFVFDKKPIPQAVSKPFVKKMEKGNSSGALPAPSLSALQTTSMDDLTSLHDRYLKSLKAGSASPDPLIMKYFQQLQKIYFTRLKDNHLPINYDWVLPIPVDQCATIDLDILRIYVAKINNKWHELKEADKDILKQIQRAYSQRVREAKKENKIKKKESNKKTSYKIIVSQPSQNTNKIVENQPSQKTSKVIENQPSQKTNKIVQNQPSQKTINKVKQQIESVHENQQIFEKFLAHIQVGTSITTGQNRQGTTANQQQSQSTNKGQVNQPGTNQKVAGASSTNQQSANPGWTPVLSQPVAKKSKAEANPNTQSESRPNVIEISTNQSTPAPPRTNQSAPTQSRPIQRAQISSRTNQQHMLHVHGPSYPAGIPRSFLIDRERQNEERPEPTPPERPIWKQTLNSSKLTPTWPTQPTYQRGMEPIFLDVEQAANVGPTQTYSPSDAYGAEQQMLAESFAQESPDAGSVSPTSGEKRVSAYQRLGPVSQSKKPKLTINLLFSKEQESRREVVEPGQRAPHVPVPQREDVLASTDETVIRYLAHWPWQKKVGVRRSATHRESKSVMIMEMEQMEEGYDSNTHFIKVSIKKYPPYFNKEHVLDLILDNVKDRSFIPCFIEFTPEECYFLVLRNRAALVNLHSSGLLITKDDLKMPLTLATVDLSINNLDFIPRLILRKRLAMAYEGDRGKLDLEAFCLQSDVSHFIYYPLNRSTNQLALVQVATAVEWGKLTELNLARNRLTSLSGFELPTTTPKLKHLDLSHNYFTKISSLLPNRGLHLKSLKLEGNPLCGDYINEQRYVKVVRMVFPTVEEIDGVYIPRAGSLPPPRANYCPPDAAPLVDRFVSVYFPLLQVADRAPVQHMYHPRATLTNTFCNRLHYRSFRELFHGSRIHSEGKWDSVCGAANIAARLARWPALRHDPTTLLVDVLSHTEDSTILRVSGIIKITAESLAEDEPLLHFTRTVALCGDGGNYCIMHEMLHWEQPTAQAADRAFNITMVRSKPLSIKLESAPDEDLKGKLIAIFMKLTDLDKDKSEKCLELRNWDIKAALEYFVKLLKLNSVSSLEV